MSTNKVREALQKISDEQDEHEILLKEMKKMEEMKCSIDKFWYYD